MIGKGRLLSVGAAVAPGYGVVVTPSNLVSSVPNGGFTSPRFNSSVSNGIGPFEYVWTCDNDEVAINTEDEESTTISSGGFESQVTARLTLTVKDTGNGGAETSNTVFIQLFFGDIF